MTTRLMIYGPNGNPVSPVVGADLTGVPNADAQAPLMVVVERECNMGSWHAIGSTQLPVYDNERDGT